MMYLSGGIMKEITKENLKEFMDYYHDLHDSFIEEINYDVSDSKIEILIDVGWSGELIVKNSKTYNNKTKLKITLNNIETFNIKDYFLVDYINKAYIKYVKLENNEYICFATDENNPLIYVVCDYIEYKQVK